MSIWNILQTFGTFSVHLAYFSGFGIMYREKIWQPRTWSRSILNLNKNERADTVEGTLSCVIDISAFFALATVILWCPAGWPDRTNFRSSLIFGEFDEKDINSPNFGAIIFTEKVMLINLIKSDMGYILGDFSHKHLVTLVSGLLFRREVTFFDFLYKQKKWVLDIFFLPLFIQTFRYGSYPAKKAFRRRSQYCRKGLTKYLTWHSSSRQISAICYFCWATKQLTSAFYGWAKLNKNVKIF
jgi:hypothetical protein